MATIYLNSGETFTNANNNQTFVGGSGVENVIFAAGVTGETVDASVERIDLSGNVASYTFTTSGANKVIVTQGTTVVATLQASGAAGQTVAFADGSAALTITGFGAIQLGGTAISSTTSAAVVPATFNTLVKSASGTAGTGTTGVGQVFTLTAGADVSGVLVGSAATTNTDGPDTFTATNLTYTAGDVLLGGLGLDVLNLTMAANPAGTATVVGIETVNVNANMFSTPTYDAAGVVGVGTAINVNNTQAGGATDFTVNNVGTGATLNAGTGITSTLTVSQAGASAITINSGTATTVTTSGATTGSTTIVGGTSLGTSTTVAKTAAITTAKTASTINIDGVGTADAATVTFSTASSVVAGAANAVETLTLVGTNTSATGNVATITGANPATTYVLSGANSITVTGADTVLSGKTFTNSTTAGTPLVKATSTTNGNDYTKVGSGIGVEITTVTTTGDDVIFAANGAVLTVSATANRLDLIAGSQTSTVTTDSITVKGTGATTIIGNATGGAGGITGTAGAYEAVSYSATVAAGAVNTAKLTLGAGTSLTLTGSNAINLGTAGESTAKEVLGTAMTGALTAIASAASLSKITSGSGNDTITLTTANAVTVDGGAGTDTLNVVADNTGAVFSNFEVLAMTGNSQFKISQLNNSTAVITDTGTFNVDFTKAGSLDATTIDLSKLVFGSASTVSIDGSQVSATVALGTALNITGSTRADTINLSTNIGNNVVNGFSGNDIITTGDGADTITGGEGADVITAGKGNDTIILTETVAAIDKVVFSGGTVAIGSAPTAHFTANGADLIIGFGVIDLLNVVNLDSTATLTAGAAIAAGTQAALVTDKAYVINTTGAAGNLTTSGTAVITDFTNTTQVAAYLSERFTAAAAGASQDVFVINNTSGTNDTSYVYAYSDVSGTSIVAGEIVLVGTVSHVAGSALTAANVVYA